ncbi:MAG: deoxyguanosinetriphosphate triphosphohydrolase [Acidobacteria bacterium]|nr:deoxyguanosinetriphosphate triphosphohydrolase [Acidobacteriota bacterium]
MHTVREETERIEREILSPHAQLASESKGRERPEEPDPLRTCFQRDRDRIVHSKSFRRLKHKTQVFIPPIGDHFRVRLTHALEVSQIARTIARALRLNEDLTEAIALGHDLGHTPFGHLGEEVLSEALGRPFRHCEQSLRVVEVLEADGHGLNLTWEVRDGIVNHSWGQPAPATLEGRVIRFADRIAYVNHDLDDAVRAGLIAWSDVPEPVASVLGRTHAERISTLVTAVVEASSGRPEVAMSAAVLEQMHALRRFLFESVYLAPETLPDRERAARVLRDLFDRYAAHPDALPGEFRAVPGDVPARVVDYIAGMTDEFALRAHAEVS